MILQRLLLSSAAILAGVSLAPAADLPMAKAAPVAYLRVCDAFGEGFFYIPGTDNCLRINGQVRAEYTLRPDAPTSNPAAFAYNQAGQVYRRDISSFRGRGYLNADSRTQTAYGTLRAFVSLRVTVDTTASGPFGGRGDTVTGVPARVSTGLFQGYPPHDSQSTLDKGFIQFAGITAGRAQSFFDFDASSYSLITNDIANSGQVTEMFAYTATFGGGFSATVSVEDSTERSIGDNGLFVFAGTKPIGNTAAGNADNPTRTNASVLAYAGEQIPDLVGNVRYDGAWGSAQLSGAYHQVRSQPVALFGAGGVATGNTVSPEADGFAVQGGVKVLLPMLAKGDNITVQAAYEEGATDYLNSVNYQPNGITNVYNNQTNGLENQFGIPINDAFIRPNGTIALSHGLGVFGAYRHYWINTVYSSLYGEWANFNNPRSAQLLGASTDSAHIWQIGFNTVYTPIKDFQIGAEVLYTNLDYYGAAALGTTPKNPDDYRARLSLRRAF